MDDNYEFRVIILEYLPDAESLNCVNYSAARYRDAIVGMKRIHEAHVIHEDVYPKNILVVPGAPERLVWVGFDVATTFAHMGPKEKEYCNYEDILVAEFGRRLV